jgi:uncharacterized protein DUF6278
LRIFFARALVTARKENLKLIRFRRRWLGHKYGPPRGVAVYGSANKRDPDRFESLALSCDGLREWSSGHELTLDDSPASLSELNECLDSWNSDETHHGKVDLSNEVGIYLGTVIIKNVEGSKWRAWPNGHPVIRLRGGEDLDVTRFANDRLNHSGPGLDTLYNQVRSL